MHRGSRLKRPMQKTSSLPAASRRAWICWSTSMKRKSRKMAARFATRASTCYRTCSRWQPYSVDFTLLTNTSSKFGVEFDSLADMVSFGVAPALVMFSWALGDLGKFGWSAAFIYVACAALRLARFNTQVGTADKNYFTGLASPAAAAIIASTVWVCNDLGLVGSAVPMELAVVVGALTAIVGFLMIANFPYYSFKGIDLRRRVPFVVMIAVVLVFGLVTLDPPSILLFCFLAYAASGPLMQGMRRHRHGRK